MAPVLYNPLRWAQSTLLSFLCLLAAVLGSSSTDRRYLQQELSQISVWLDKAVFNYHPGKSQVIKVKFPPVVKTVGNKLDISATIFIQESPSKKGRSTCTELAFNITRPIKDSRGRAINPPYTYKRLGSRIISSWNNVCTKPPPPPSPAPNVGPKLALAGPGWTRLPVTSVSTVASYAIHTAFAKDASQISKLNTVTAARAEQLSNGVLYEVFATINRSGPDYMVLTPPHRFYVYEDSTLKLTLVAASSNVTQQAGGWTKLSASDSTTATLAQFATNPNMMMGMSHCPAVQSAQVQSLGAEIGFVYTITAAVTSKAVVLHPGKGSSVINTYTLLVESPLHVSSKPFSNDDTTFGSDDAQQQLWTPSTSTSGKRLLSTQRMPQACTEPYPCDSPGNDDGWGHPSTLAPPSSTCEGPNRLMCVAGKSASCINGEWECVQIPSTTSPVFNPRGQNGDPLPTPSCGPEDLITCTAPSRAICQPSGVWDCVTAMNPPLRNNSPVFPTSPCGPNTPTCLSPKIAQCEPSGAWVCVLAVDPGGPIRLPIIDPLPPVDLPGLPLPSPKSISKSAWTPLLGSSASLAKILQFAAQTVNNINNPPRSAAMAMLISIDSVPLARFEPAGSGGVMYEFIAAVTKRPNCKADMPCPMYVMCGQTHFVVFEDSSKTLSLVENHDVQGGGCGINAQLGLTAKSTLATNWQAMNLTSNLQQTLAASLAQWASNPRHMMGVSYSARPTSALSQSFPDFGRMFQITAEVTAKIVVWPPSNGTCSVHKFLISVLADSKANHLWQSARDLGPCAASM